jgi:hypothetical protein
MRNYSGAAASSSKRTVTTPAVSPQHSPPHTAQGAAPRKGPAAPTQHRIKLTVVPAAESRGVTVNPAFSVEAAPSLTKTPMASRQELLAAKPATSAWAKPLLPPKGPSSPPPASPEPVPPSLPPTASVAKANEPAVDNVLAWLSDQRFPGMQKFFYAFIRVADSHCLNTLLIGKLTTMLNKVQAIDPCKR